MGIKLLLTVELIPSTCHYSNVRTTVKPSEWDKLRKMAYTAADNKCGICGELGKEQGHKHDLECHEIWHYDDETHVQKLTGLIALCPNCHLTKHIGRAMAMRRAFICHKHMAKVNKWTQVKILEHIAACFEVHKERSKHKWTLDLSILNAEPYNLNIDITKQRIFEIKKYKKKRKRKVVKKKVATKRPPKK